MAERRERRARAVSVTLIVALAALAGFLFLERLVRMEMPPKAEDHPAPGEEVQFDRFSARVERAADGERLSVSLRLRTSVAEGLPCYAFVVARNAGSPRVWSIWPPQPNGSVITAGGHFHGTDPSSGFSMTLTDAWQRITATVANPDGGASFDTVVVYVLSPSGTMLLVRPFHV